MIKLFSNFLFVILLLFSMSCYSEELKPLEEIFEDTNTSKNSNSFVIMKRCAALYGALYFVNPSDNSSNEFENRYKIFLQSAVLEDIKLNKINEDEAYKKQLEIFKSTIKFFIQIFLQNQKKNNSYLKNHWLEKDFFICEKF